MKSDSNGKLTTNLVDVEKGAQVHRDAVRSASEMCLGIARTINGHAQNSESPLVRKELTALHDTMVKTAGRIAMMIG